MKTLKTLGGSGWTHIHQIKNENGAVKYNKSETVQIVENYYKKLYSPNANQETDDNLKLVLNIGFEDTLNIATVRLEKAEISVGYVTIWKLHIKNNYHFSGG